MVFQQYNLFSHKTVLQNITEGLIVARKIKKDIAESIAHEQLKRVGLSDKADFYPVQLSGGQAQRVGIARALASILMSFYLTNLLLHLIQNW